MVETIQICMGSAEMLNTFFFVGEKTKNIEHMKSDNEHKIKAKFQIIIADHPNKNGPNAGEKRNNYEIQTRTKGKK